MSIFLKAVQRTNPQDPKAPKRWFPVQYTTKMVDENEVAMLIADKTTDAFSVSWTTQLGESGNSRERGGCRKRDWMPKECDCHRLGNCLLFNTNKNDQL